MYVQDVKDFVVVPTLQSIHKFIPFTEDAMNLVLGTAAQESNFHYLDQTAAGPGPGFGIYQCERATFHDDWGWLRRDGNEEFFDLVNRYQIIYLDNVAELHGNLYLATIMCRAHYFRKPGAIPATVQGKAQYWKQHYNSYLGAGTVEEFIANYGKYVAPLK